VHAIDMLKKMIRSRKRACRQSQRVRYPDLLKAEIILTFDNDINTLCS